MKPYRLSSLEHSTKQQGMNLTLKLIKWMSIFILIFTVENVYSQSDTLYCDDILTRWYGDTCTAPWVTKSYIGNLGSGITAMIYYKVQDGCEHKHFVVDSVIALDNGHFLDSVNVNQYSYSAFSDLVDIYLLQHHYQRILPYNKKPPLERQDTISCIIKLYKASCGIFLKCTYRVVSDFYPKCDSGYDPPYPTSISQEPQELSIYKFHPCGKICCMKAYDVKQKDIDPGEYPNDRWIIEITRLRTTNKGHCTEQKKFFESGDGSCGHGC